MLHRSRATQDENEISRMRGKLYALDAPLTGKKSSLAPGKRQIDAENPKLGKGVKPANAMPRKALGDITNATPASKNIGGDTLIFGNQKATPLLKPTVKHTTRPKEDVWAEEGIERIAGKGWKEMQREKEEKANSEFRQRARQAVSQKHDSLSRARLGRVREQNSWKALSRIKIPQKPPSCPSSDGVLSDLEDLDLSDLEFSLNVSCPQLTCVDL